MQIPGVSVMLLGGWFLIGVCAIQAVIAVLRLTIRTVPAGVARTTAVALASAIRSGRDPAPVIAAAAPRLRWPYSWHAHSAAKTLASDPAAGIVATLARHRLLPKALIASGDAAERLGAPALVRWAESLSVRPGWGETLFRPLALYVSVGIFLGVMFTFISVFIVPKFKSMAIDLGVELDSRLALIARLPEPMLLAAAVAFLSLFLVVVLGTWRWRRTRRVLAAEVILAGTLCGASEGEIAASFSGDAARQAGEAGSFPALAAAAGWPGVADPTALAAQLAEAEDRDHRRLTWIRLTLQIAAPIILAIPVWLIASGMFGTLIAFLNAAGEGVLP